MTPEKLDRLQRILEHHDLVAVQSSYEAMRHLLSGDFGMVILGVHFDESQMFTLLSDIRAHATYKKVPILCVLGERGRVLSDIAVDGLDHAVKAMTANGFLDLKRFADDDEGNGRIRRIIDYLILIDGDLQNPAAQSDNGVPVLNLLDRRGTRRS
jgi:hypothetical protein